MRVTRGRKLYQPLTVESVVVGLTIASVTTALVGLTLALFICPWLGITMGGLVFGLSIDVLFFPPPEGKA